MAILTFGKYKGHTVNMVAVIDYNYLVWVVMNMGAISDEVLREIWKVLPGYISLKLVSMLQRQRAAKFNSRDSTKQERPWEDQFKASYESAFGSGKAPPTGSFTKVDAVSVDKNDLTIQITRWYRDSAKKWHPDSCKGSDEPMKALNECYERLKELIRNL